MGMAKAVFYLVCVATNGAMRFSVCSSVWSYTLFYFMEVKEMKKAISLILMLALCFGLCACGVDTAAVDRELQGKWTNATGMAAYRFDDGRFACATIIDTKEGSYEITNRKIVLNYDNGVTGELSYTFKNGVLSLDGLTKK